MTLASAELTPLFEFLTPLLEFGYQGAFLLSLFGSLLPFIPTPYFLPVALLSLNPAFDPWLVTVSSALGSSIAKTVIVRVSYTGRRLMSKETEARLKPLEKLVSKYGWFAAFLAAATPIPDDIVYIPLGLTRYSVWRFFLAALPGKIIITGIVAWGTRLLGVPAIQFLLETATSPAVLIVSVASLVLVVIVLVYALLKIDWGVIVSRWFPSLLKD
jgi:membrane protein DedA with SNARE-associated domain